MTRPKPAAVGAAGLFDPAKEIERLTRQQGKLGKELGGLAGRLSNPKFLDRAAPAVVAEARQQQVPPRLSFTAAQACCLPSSQPLPPSPSVEGRSRTAQTPGCPPCQLQAPPAEAAT